MKKLISIIIPAYNAEKYIGDCIESCLNQDIIEDEYEIIVINDGSTDNTSKIVEKYSKEHKNIMLINQRNRGVSVARNNGIYAARGMYLWFVDSDDMIVKNCLRFIKQKLLSTNCDRLGFIISEFSDRKVTDLNKNSKNLDKFIFNSQNSMGFVFSIVNHDFILKHNIRFKPELKIGEDIVFTCEFNEYYNSKEYIDKIVYLYRIHPESTMHMSKDIYESIEQNMLLIETLKKMYDANKYNREEKEILIYRRLPSIMGSISRLSINDANAYIKRLKKIGLFPFVVPAKYFEYGIVCKKYKIINMFRIWIKSNSATPIGYIILRIVYRFI